MRRLALPTLTGLILSVAALTACGGDDPTIVLDLGDSGTTITVPTGTRLEISLPANPTTGYTWEVMTATGVTLIGEPTHVADSDLVGAPGTTTFLFEPAEGADGIIDLVYHRTWEDAAPLERFSVTIDG